MSYQVDSYGNAYFPAGVSVASIPATTGTQAKVLVPGVNGRISSATVAQLITQSGGNLVTSVFGRTGAVTAQQSDYTTDQVTEGQAQYFSTSRARKSIFLTTFNTSGPATYDSSTGILNVPQYVSNSGSGTGGSYVPLTRTISINGQTADLSVDRAFSIDTIPYPSIGIPLSNGTSWGASIVNNSANWNTAYGWGNHAIAGYALDTQVVHITGAETVAGLKTFTSAVKAPNFILSGGTGNTGMYFGHTDRLVLANYGVGGIDFESNGGVINGTLFPTGNWGFSPSAVDDTINRVQVGGYVIATGYRIPSGTASQFLKANGSIDNTSYTPTSRTLTINGTAYDLTADRAWTIAAYILPTATTTILGGVKVGTNLSIDANGVLSANDTSVAWTELTGVPSTFTPSVHTHAISDITTIVITSVANDQLLKYNSTTAKWENWTPTYISSYTDTNTTYSLTIPVSTTKIRLTGSDASTSDIIFTGSGATTITRTSATEFTISSTDTDTVYVHPTTAGNKHIPAGGAAGQILRYSSDGTAAWGADNDTTYTLAGLGGQAQLNGTGFVKASGTTITYDNSTYYLSSNPSGYISSYTETDTLASVTGRGASTSTAVVINNSLAVNHSSHYDSAQFSLDVNGGLLVKNVGKTALFLLINSNPATGGNHAFVQHTVGGTLSSSFATIQGYYGTSITGSTVLKLNPLGGDVLIGTLIGTGTRMVVADANGVVSTQAIPSVSTIAWTSVTSRPTALSQFTNDLGNYGGWITSYTETDTLASVTARGATTTTALTLSSQTNNYGGHHYFISYDAAGNHYPHYQNGSSNTGAIVNTRVYTGSGASWRLFILNGQTAAISWDGNVIYHAGNIPTWNQNTTGTAANITATTNSTLTTLSSLSLPYSQLSGTVPTWNQSTTGNAATVTNATFYRQFTVRDDRSDGNDYSLANRPTGLYAITSTGTNGPGSTYSSLIHVANGGDVAFQIAGGYTSDSMYFRGTYALQNGTGYSAWRTVIHSGNIASQTVTYATGETLATVTSRGSSTAQNITFSNGRKGLIGIYDASQTQAIFAMGAAYILTDGGASSNIGNLYGLAWSYNPDYGGAGNNPQSKAGLNHQLLLMQNGVTTAAMGSGIWTSGNISAANFSGSHSGSSSGTNTGDQTNISGTAASETLATVTGRGATTTTAVIINNNLAVNTASPYATSVYSLDINGGLLVKNTGRASNITLINSDPAGGGNHAFVIHTVSGTLGSSLVDIQGYYGANITGSTTIRLNPLGGNVTINGYTVYHTNNLPSIPTNTNQLTNGANYITSSSLTSYVPYTGATADVNLGSRALSAGNILGTTLSASSSSASSGLLTITNSGAGRIADFQNSGALVAYITNAGGIYGSSFIKSGGSSSQFLKADGSIDSSSYITSSGSISGTANNITAYTINQSVGTGNSPTFAGLTVSGPVYQGLSNQGVISLLSDVVVGQTNNYFRLYLPQGYYDNRNGGTATIKIVWGMLHAGITYSQEYKLTFGTNHGAGGNYLIVSDVTRTYKDQNPDSYGGYLMDQTPAVDFYQDMSGGYINFNVKGVQSYNTHRVVAVDIVGGGVGTPTLTYYGTTSPGGSALTVKDIPYASTAGSANSVAWTNVSSRPTALSSFTNDVALPLNGNWVGNTGMNDQKLYLRTNGDNNHYIWNAADDWEEIVAYSGTGLRIAASNATTLATFTTSGLTVTGAITAAGVTTLNGAVNINRHIDANTAWGSCTSIFVGWSSGKVILGNNANAGHDYALNLGCNSVVSTNAFYCHQDITAFSDARVKENVEVVDNALDKIQAIRGVTFTRNDTDDTDKRHVGVIAQEVLAVLPEAVSEDDRGYYSVAYGNMAALFIEAIKEQQAQIEEMKKEIKELKNK